MKLIDKDILIKEKYVLHVNREFGVYDSFDVSNCQWFI
jgi:hypothetical protein